MTTAPHASVEQARALLSLNTAYHRAKALHSAVELGLFELLAAGPATIAEIRERLGLAHPLTEEYLKSLAALGLLDRDGASFRNTPAAAAFLVPTSSTYLGGSVLQHARKHYHVWAGLTTALREGGADSGAEAHGPEAYPQHYADPDRARQVMAHFDTFSTFTAKELACRVDWERYRTFVDIGGARGNLASRLALAHPHLSGTIFDLPALAPLCAELVAERGVEGRVGFQGGDFRTDPLPTADAVVIGHVLPDWPLSVRRKLLARIFDALPSGGALVIYDLMTDPGTETEDDLLQRLNHGLIRGDSSSCSVQECREAVAEAGFRVRQTERIDNLLGDWLVVALKP
ncbi:acetylserotonin O-methyltransferase [Streptomyces halobius]|uniref:Acetylserotonin O-methyltransferase n=1 Tax=Streptomyces halobius TaxID=2879846 RepID=A0ABY4M4G3_9ACTN|nr:acetylserotonin O-methyltransferase [Streptomyces halobius]UQA92610.1 acetylserotonin O-methyltransferase [Streptomyces halobius]